MKTLQKYLEQKIEEYKESDGMSVGPGSSIRGPEETEKEKDERIKKFKKSPAGVKADKEKKTATQTKTAEEAKQIEAAKAIVKDISNPQQAIETLLNKGYSRDQLKNWVQKKKFPGITTWTFKDIK